MNYNWNVSDEEKKRIISLHESATKNLYLLNEQNEQNEQPFTIDFGDTFNSGQYTFTPQFEKTVNDRVTQIVNYIKNKNLKQFKITITPGESQVRNQINPETGNRFEVGELAQKRGEVLKAYLQKVISSSLSMTPQIEVLKSVIGQTPPGANKDDQKYKNEQFVRASVIVLSTNPPVEQHREGTIGESIFLNNYLIGIAQVPSFKSDTIKNQGNLDTGHENVIFNEVKKDTQPLQIISRYEVPWEWWNSKRELATTNRITSKDLETIRTFNKVS